MSKAIRWTDQQLADYEKKVGRPLLQKTEAPKEKKTKYHSTRVETDGEVYQSQREAKRHYALQLLVDSGQITDLHRHVTFKLAPKVKQEGQEKATPALRYEADFVYVEDGRLVVEDCKGLQTRVYKMKRHLMKTLHNIDIIET